MKVLMLNTLYHPHVSGGAERSVQILAETLVAQHTEVVVVSTVGSEAPATNVINVINGVKVVSLPIANLYWPFDRVDHLLLQRKLWHVIDLYNPAMKSAVARLIHQERPTVLHTNNLQGISVAAWRAAREARVPVLHTLRDYYLTCARCLRYRNGRICRQTCGVCLPFLLVRKRASASVTGVVGNSRAVRDHHRELGFFVNVCFSAVIHNACPPVRVARGTRTMAAPLVFGYLGSLTPAKGIELLLDTFGARKDGGWELLVAGEGNESYCQELHRRYTALEDRSAVRFLGWTDPSEFFPQIDVLVVPSLWQEPLPRVILEAYTYGVPVIGSRRGGILELIEDGVTGCLFDPSNPQTLGTILDRLLQDRALSGKLGQSALRRAQEYAPERIASQYQEAYRAVLESTWA